MRAALSANAGVWQESTVPHEPKQYAETASPSCPVMNNFLPFLYCTVERN